MDLNWCTICAVPMHRRSVKWRGEGSNPWPFDCESNILPLDQTRTKAEVDVWVLLCYLLIVISNPELSSISLQLRFLWNHINELWRGRNLTHTPQVISTYSIVNWSRLSWNLLPCNLLTSVLANLHSRDYMILLRQSAYLPEVFPTQTFLDINLNWCTICRVPIHRCPVKWRGEGSNPWPFDCESNILPLD